MTLRSFAATLLITSTLFAGTVQADMPVIDASSILRLGQEIQQLTSILQQAEATTHSLTSIPQNLMSQVSGLLNEITSNPLGGNVVPNINTILHGNQGLGSCPGGDAYQSVNTYYAPTGTDFTGQWVNQRSTMNAGMQACTNQMLASTQSNLTQLPMLLNQLQGAQTESEATSINGRIMGQLTIIMSQLQQLIAMSNMASNQRDMMELQVTQKQRADEEERYRNTLPSATTANALPAPSVFVAQ